MIKALQPVACLALALAAAPSLHSTESAPDWRPVALLEIEVASPTLEPRLLGFPSVIRNKIHAIFQGNLEQLRQAGFDTDPAKLFARETFQRCNLSTGEYPGLQLFVISVPQPTGPGSKYALFLFDPGTNRTGEPHTFYDKWLDAKGVQLRVTDLDLDGTQEIVYRDFQHNGTVENIDQDVYLAIDEQLGLTEVLRVSTFAADMGLVSSAGVVATRLMRNAASAECELGLDHWKENPYDGVSPEDLGRLALAYDQEQGRWQIPK